MTTTEPSQSSMDLIGDRIRLARKQAGLTLADVSERVGYTTSQLSRAERSQRNPSLRLIRALASVLKVKEGWLVSGAPDMSEEGFPDEASSLTLEAAALGQARRALRRLHRILNGPYVGGY